MTANASCPETEHELRWIADAFEQAQRVRIQMGERIRAVVQRRDSAEAGEAEETLSAAQVLKRIRCGEMDGPVPLLGRTYRRFGEEEEELARAIREALEQHPAWHWLEGVKGIGPLLAGKLLARLDVAKADTPSSFWAYCGLATVPGNEYRCSTCGYTVSFPTSFRVSGTHVGLGGRKPCPGTLLRTRGPEEGVRVAQPKPQKGERAAYDMYAKKVCYLIGVSFLKAGGPYERFYRRERAKLDRTRAGWAEGRRHLTALRKTEKLFLSHLWLVWREAADLPTTEPYAQAEQGHGGWIDPWEMSVADRPPSSSLVKGNSDMTPRILSPPTARRQRPLRAAGRVDGDRAEGEEKPA